MTTPLEQALTLPCGLALSNRIVKPALSEFLADREGAATEELVDLYRVWGHGGAGLLITGNVMVDRRYIEAPGNVVLDEENSDAHIQRLSKWAVAAQEGGSRVFMQLGHAGAQTPEYVCERPVGPSLRRTATGGSGAFRSAPCRALVSEEIEDVVKRFVRGIELAARTGFDGVQIHACHGHLISQFLSPRANQRCDKWGGTVENRSRLLLEVIREARQVVPESFGISVKLNVSDFVPGGLSFDDCIAVVEWLNIEAVDFIEITGGVPVQPQMFGLTFPDFFEDDGRLAQGRNDYGAYFATFARLVKSYARTPVMLTGGLRATEQMNRLLDHRCADLLGVGRPLCIWPDLPSKILNGDVDQIADLMPKGFGPKAIVRSDIGSTSVRDWYAEAVVAWHALLLDDLTKVELPDTRRGLIAAIRRLRKRVVALHRG